GRDGVVAAGDGDEQDVDLSHHFQLVGSQNMAEIAQVGDADIVDAKNKNRIFATLHAVAFVVKRRNYVNRDVADRSRIFCQFSPVDVRPCKIAGVPGAM
ncbi:MAG: hypothetical protein QOF64_678, partial [Candidatus Binatota bacterium]|nr:hypothetical protein [Candidatus Binatota bacterium]